MELFVACIGLIFAFNNPNEQPDQNLPQNDEQPEQNLPQNDEQLEQNVPQINEIQSSWLGAIWLGFCYPVIILSALYVIYKIPVNIATGENFITSMFQLIRFIIHLPNLLLTIYICCLYSIKPKINRPSEPDIFILWVAWIINLLRVSVKLMAEIIWYWPYLNSVAELTSRIFATFGNICETITFFFLIFIVDHFLKIAERSYHEDVRAQLGKVGLVFLPFYFCISLIAFVAYYFGQMYQIGPREKIDNVFGLNLLVLLQTTYPTIMLYTMTVCLCIGTCLVQLYKNGYYNYR